MNEMTVEQFRKKLKARVCMLGTSGGFYILATALSKWYESSNRVQEVAHRDFMSGFSIGAAIGIMLLIFVLGVQAMTALKNQERFDKLYIAETDERSKFIKDKCGSRVILPTSITLLAVAVILGNYNFTVFATLLCASLFQLLVCLVIKIYYCKKY